MINIIISELSILDKDITSTPDTKLFGNDGILDSMGLVNLVVSLEERIQEEYDVAITLADESAMSLSKSPFLTVASLADYIKELLREEGVNV